MSALQNAIEGKNLSDGQAKGALRQAVDKIQTMNKSAGKLKANLANGTAAVIQTMETQGTVFMASMAEGYFGEDKMKLGPVDMRLGVGLAVGGIGITQALSGKGGEHALAFGNGFLAAGIATLGRNAGHTLRTKKAADAGAAAPGSPTTTKTNGDIEGSSLRAVTFTPDPEPVRPTDSNRFVKARRLDRQAA